MQRIELMEESFANSQKLAVLGLFAFSAMLALWGLSGGPCLSDHEAIVAQGARQIRQDGNWLIPQVNDVPFIRKPPLAFWLAAAASWAVDPHSMQLPVSPMAARLPSALAAIGTSLIVYFLGRAMFGHRIGILCGAIMSICVGGLYFSHNAQVEMTLTFFCTASFACFWLGTESTHRPRLFMMLFYVALALALLSKAPLPIATVGLPLFIWWFVTIPLASLHTSEMSDNKTSRFLNALRRQFGELRRLWLLPGILLAAVIFLPWPIYIYMHVENALDLWHLEFLDRFAGDLSDTPQPFWFYLPFILLFAFPFSLSIPEAFASPFRKIHASQRKALLFVFTWAVVQIVFLSASSFKRPHYLIGAIPAFALLLGPTIDRLFLAARSFSMKNVKRIATALAIAVPIAFVIGGFVLAKEMPQLLKNYTLLGIVSTIGTTACCIAFTSKQRMLSLAILHVCIAISFILTWDGLGQSRAVGAQPIAMVEQLRAHSIDAADRITWVMGRPDARLIYYAGREIPPLFTTMELAPRRDGRKMVPRELLMEGVDRLTQRLSSQQEEYFIIDAKYWDQLCLFTNPPAREVLRVAGDDPKGGEDWVVITNRWNTGEEEDVAEVTPDKHHSFIPGQNHLATAASTPRSKP